MPPDVARRVSLADRIAAFLNPPDGTDRAMLPIPPAEAKLPQGSDPRTWVPPQGYNRTSSPRLNDGNSLTPFEQLRALARYDLVRIAIEDVKGQVLGMAWDIRVRPEFRHRERRLAAKIDRARKWARKPYALAPYGFEGWLTQVLEEVLTTDALALVPAETVGGEKAGLRQIDGTTIVPLVDALGETPQPPAPAYQQVPRGTGQPETEFTTEELWYEVKNRRVWTPYGCSPTEQVLLTVNLALRNQMHDLAYYTAGNVPDSLWSVPETWTPAQIQAAQTYFDSVVAGNSDERSGRLIIVPPGSYIPTKDRAWAYDFNEWIARVICWSFGVSPMPLVKLMNRATAQEQEISSLESGVRPVTQFVESVLNRYLSEVLDSPEVQFTFGADETEDPAIVFQRNVAYLNAGVLAIDEVRDELGLDPITNGLPPMIPGPNGPIRVDTLASSPAPPSANTGAPPPAPGGAPPFSVAPPASLAARGEDLRRWRTVAEKAVKAGKVAKTFRSNAIDQETRVAVWTGLRRARTVEEVREVFRKAELATLDRKAEDALVEALDDWFAEILPDLIAWGSAQIEAAGDPDETETQDEAAARAGKLAKGEAAPEFPYLDASTLHAKMTEALSDAYTKGGKQASGALGVDFDTFSESAYSFAYARGAELVGMKEVPPGSGNWITNPNPKWAITETMRGDVQAKLEQAIAEGWSPQKFAAALRNETFGPWRAKTIARTETGFAYNEGAIKVYTGAGVQSVEILDGEGCLPKGHRDGASKPDVKPGEVETDKEANGQVWTVEQFSEYRLGHPNCVRAAVPRLEDDEQQRLDHLKPKPAAPAYTPPTPVENPLWNKPAPAPKPAPTPKAPMRPQVDVAKPTKLVEQMKQHPKWSRAFAADSEVPTDSGWSGWEKWRRLQDNVSHDVDLWGRLKDATLRSHGAMDSSSVHALRDYQGSGYYNLNKYLRGKLDTSGMTQDQIERIKQLQVQIDAAFKKATPLPEDTIVYRKAGRWPDSKNWPDEIGNVYTDNGFMSTSVSATSADGFDGNVIFRITVPKGTKVTQLLGSNGSFYEGELLAPRGSRMKVTGFKNLPGGKVVVDVDYLPPAGAAKFAKAAPPAPAPGPETPPPGAKFGWDDDELLALIETATKE